MTFNANSSSSIAPSIDRREPHVVARLLSAILSQWPQRTRGSPPGAAHLRRDLGLAPRETGRSYWDHE